MGHFHPTNSTLLPPLSHSLYIHFLFCHDSVAKHLESANTMFSFIWWIIGFYWVSAGGRSLAHASPLLFWFVITPCLHWVLKLMVISSQILTSINVGRTAGYVSYSWALMCSLWFYVLLWHVSLGLLFAAVFPVSLHFYML